MSPAAGSHAAGSHAAGCSGRVAYVSVGSEGSGGREAKKLTKKLDCGLIHLIMEGFFVKHSTKDPNHGTVTYFIITSTIPVRCYGLRNIIYVYNIMCYSLKPMAQITPTIHDNLNWW
jgi:hypothetical protein